VSMSQEKVDLRDIIACLAVVVITMLVLSAACGISIWVIRYFGEF
jgi:hypothetical protein